MIVPAFTKIGLSKKTGYFYVIDSDKNPEYIGYLTQDYDSSRHKESEWLPLNIIRDNKIKLVDLSNDSPIMYLETKPSPK